MHIKVSQHDNIEGLRELLEKEECRNYNSNLKDIIQYQVIVNNIATTKVTSYQTHMLQSSQNYSTFKEYITSLNTDKGMYDQLEAEGQLQVCPNCEHTLEYIGTDS